MSDEKSKNIKWIVLLALSVVVIALNVHMMVGSKAKKARGPYRKPQVSEFYMKDAPPFQLLHKKGKIQIPNGENVLIVGVSRKQKSEFKEFVVKMAEMVAFESFNAKVYLASTVKPSVIDGVSVYQYDGKQFFEDYQIGPSQDFLLLIGRDGKIQYYYPSIESLRNIRNLLNRFKKGGP